MSVFKVEMVANLHVDVSHKDGHRWFFRFPKGYCGGAVPMYRQTDWADGIEPDDPLLTRSAATVAIQEAKRRQWF